VVQKSPISFNEATQEEVGNSIEEQEQLMALIDLSVLRIQRAWRVALFRRGYYYSS
jgi:hypothetical protein